MSSDLDEEGKAPGGRVDVSWAWTGHADRPAFRLLRRPRTHPVDPDGGYLLVDSTELFRGSDEPWERVSRVRYVVEEGSTEGGLVAATLALFHDVPGASVPVRLDLAMVSPSGDALARREITDVTRVEYRETQEGATQTIEIFRAQQGGVERSEGRVVVSAGEFRWEPREGDPARVSFDRTTLTQTRAEVRRPSDAERLVVWLRTLRLDAADLSAALSDPDEALPGAHTRTSVVTLREELSPPGGDRTRSFRVSDLTASEDEISCYTLFAEDPASPSGWITERGWKASAGGGAPRGFDDPMLGGFPSVQHYVHEPAADEPASRGDRRENGRSDGRVSSSASRSPR